MSGKGWFGAGLALTVCGALGLGSAPSRADVLYAATPLVVGSLASVTDFTVSGPGTVTVTLTDLGFTERLASLTFAATTPTGVITSMSGPGQISFAVTTPGIYSAVIGALAQGAGPLALGWYSVTIGFAPAVPLPGTLALLLSALLGIAALRKLGPQLAASSMNARLSPGAR
jgi:hypothetical protein